MFNLLILILGLLLILWQVKIPSTPNIFQNANAFQVCLNHNTESLSYCSSIKTYRLSTSWFQLSNIHHCIINCIQKYIKMHSSLLAQMSIIITVN